MAKPPSVPFVLLTALIALTVAGCSDEPRRTDILQLAQLVPPDDEEFIAVHCDGDVSWDPVDDTPSGWEHRDIIDTSDY